MADKLSYVQISERIQSLNLLQDMPEMDEQDRTRVQEYLDDLASRQENKFDNIIGMIKKCDTYISVLEEELNEIKTNLDAWKRNKEMMVNIIKFAYQQELIGNKPTGAKYQGVFRKVKPKLVDNFQDWGDTDRTEFGLRKTVTITRIKDGEVLEVKEEEMADKERLREVLTAEESNAPSAVKLVPGYSFTYERRKRLTEDWSLLQGAAGKNNAANLDQQLHHAIGFERGVGQDLWCGCNQDGTDSKRGSWHGSKGNGLIKL